MKSHIIPQRLLEQFAYHDPVTRSLRLWKYSKGRPPYGRASPKTAARVDGFFANPDNRGAEQIIEKKLADEIEHPVHKFMKHFDDPSFSLSSQQRQQMTRYVNLLFNRCPARKEATKHTRDIIKAVFERFASNQERLLTVAAHWSIKAFFRGEPMLFTPQHVADAAQKRIDYLHTEAGHQQGFSDLIATALTGSMTPTADKAMIIGDWNILRTSSDAPFLLSDTPVVTWERLERNEFNFGLGFERPNLEVILPVSPLSCLHILPAVKRTRTPIAPTVTEVNFVQIAFAHQSCFADRKSDEIDTVVQKNISKFKIGQNAFTLWHRKFDDLFYDIMMQQG